MYNPHPVQPLLDDLKDAVDRALPGVGGPPAGRRVRPPPVARRQRPDDLDQDGRAGWQFNRNLFGPKNGPNISPKTGPKVPFNNDAGINFEFWTLMSAFGPNFLQL